MPLERIRVRRSTFVLPQQVTALLTNRTSLTRLGSIRVSRIIERMKEWTIANCSFHMPRLRNSCFHSVLNGCLSKYCSSSYLTCVCVCFFVYLCFSVSLSVCCLSICLSLSIYLSVSRSLFALFSSLTCHKFDIAYPMVSGFGLRSNLKRPAIDASVIRFEGALEAVMVLVIAVYITPFLDWFIKGAPDQ